MSAALQAVPFAIIGLNSVTTDWDGSRMTLEVNQSVTMVQTPNGTMLFAWENVSLQNNQGALMVTSGSSLPTPLNAYALTYQPCTWVNNWKANNLTVTNVSANATTPIVIQAYGPGLGSALTLEASTPLQVASGQAATGTVLPQNYQLVMQVSGGVLGVIVVIGGPLDDKGNNGYVFGVNVPSLPPASGCPTTYNHKSTTNTYVYTFNWGSSVIYVANMSASSVVVTLTLRPL